VRRVTIRTKLVGALLPPIMTLVAAATVGALKVAAEADDVRDQAVLAEISLGPSSLVTQLEHERNAASVYLTGLEGNFALPVENNTQARAEMDEALEAFRNDLDDLASQGRDLEEVYGRALSALDELDALRAEVDSLPDAERTLGNTAAASANFNGYAEIMDELFAANLQVARSIDDADLRRGAELYDLSARQTDAVARLTRDLLTAAAGGEANGLDRRGELASVGRWLGQLRTYDTRIRLTAQGEYRPLAERLYSADHIRRFPRLVEAAVQTGDVDIVAVMESSTGEDPTRVGYTAFRSEVSDLLQRQADDLRRAADVRRVSYLGLTLLVLSTALVAAWLGSRSISRPLRSLTRQAKDIADQRLPDAMRDLRETSPRDVVEAPEVEPVAVSGPGQVADIVTSLNTVQEWALGLAVEQALLRRNTADLFVNLGRRNQRLLARQLDFIGELESHETDPDTLASLFRLDHLATRMRRNAESLLVLAGVEPPRKWASPVQLIDVVRAALGEVEDYQRVSAESVDPATVLGSAAADLAHLLAEFIENALAFSPPDRYVDVQGVRRRDGGYTVTVTNVGLSMSDRQIEHANRRLAGDESFTIAPSRYLGHYVAAHLAFRHGVTLRLDNPSDTGTTATIALPATLLTDDVAPLARATSVAALPTRRHQPPAPPLVERFQERPFVATVDAHTATRDPDALWSGGHIDVPDLDVWLIAGGRAPGHDDRSPAREQRSNGLTRRVAGAQLPRTRVRKLRTDNGMAQGAGGPAAGPASTMTSGSGGGQLHDLLSQLAQGFDRARREAPHRDVDGSR
jgi:signal transduction histidine kinase